jgi:predicted N-acetyltransferase YhbS
MSVRIRNYMEPMDFKLVGDFLVKHFQPGNQDGNWLQPTWEYMHSHPYLDEASLEKIGIWEDSGEIVGVVHYESKVGEVFFEIHSDYTYLKSEMLDYAEEHLFGTTESGNHFVRAYITDMDLEFQALVQSRGYQRDAKHDRPISQFKIPRPFTPITLPDGFHLQSLQEDNDLYKIHRVLWRGFNHKGEPPEEGIEDRRKMQSVPNYRKDLNIVVVAPDGNFVSYSGTWFDPTNRFAYMEPVATDPVYRRRGLGTAAVLEGIRRCVELGATVAFVGSDQEFYISLGFEKIYTSECWQWIAS